MPEERVELSWGCPRRILSPLRLPFRHSGRFQRAKYTIKHAAATEQRVAAALSLNPLDAPASASANSRTPRWSHALPSPKPLPPPLSAHFADSLNELLAHLLEA